MEVLGTVIIYFTKFFLFNFILILTMLSYDFASQYDFCNDHITSNTHTIQYITNILHFSIFELRPKPIIATRANVLCCSTYN